MSTRNVPCGEPNIFGHQKATPEQEALDAKREYNIALREQRYDAKQKELSAIRKQKKILEAEKRERIKKAEAMKRQSNLSQGLAKKQCSIFSLFVRSCHPSRSNICLEVL